MTNRRSHLSYLLLTAAVTCSVAAAADPPDEMFQSHFAREIRQVKATSTFTDDEKLAGDMLAMARTATDDARLLAVICRNVHDLSVKTPRGFDLAVEALDLLARTAPDQAAACNEKVLAIRRRQYAISRNGQRQEAGEAFLAALVAVADDKADARQCAEAAKYLRQAVMLAKNARCGDAAHLQARAKELSAMEALDRQALQLRALLAARPDDPALRRRVIHLYLIERNDPVGAAGFLREDCPEILRTYVPMSAGHIGPLAPAACLELGDWYKHLASKAHSQAKAAMLLRARGFYQDFLREHSAQPDIRLAKALLALKTIDRELDRLPPAATAGPWHDVLKGVDPAKHGVAGEWRKTATRLGAAAATASRIVIPVAPNGDYELKIDFVRTDGDNDVDFILPVGSAAVALMLSHRSGMAGGLSLIDGKFCQDNVTRSPGKLANHHRHSLYVRVIARGEDVEISARLNGRRLVRWSGPQKSLTVPRDCRMPRTSALGLGVGRGTTAVFYSVKLRMLSGKAEGVCLEDPPRGKGMKKPGGLAAKNGSKRI